MFIIFIEYEEFNQNFEYLYNLFYTLNIKIKLINNIEIKDYIINNYKKEDIYIFYEIFDLELFTFINTKYNRVIYYFIENYQDKNKLENKYKKNNFILLSNSYVYLADFKYEKILLNHSFTMNKCIINELNDIYIYKNNDLINNLNDNKINYKYLPENEDIYNKIIIINDIVEEKVINKLIFKKNLIIKKNNKFL